MKLKINCNEWLRGEDSSDSFLLRPSDSKMCCLGFLARECGLTETEIYDRNDFSEVRCTNLMEQIRNSQHQLFISINDNPTIEDEERKQELTRLFKLYNIEVEFVEE